MILILGDVHGEFGHILPAIERQQERVDAVIFLGDIEAPKPFEECIQDVINAGVEVYFIHGNHDSDTAANWDNLQGSQHRDISGKVVTIAGLRVAGLGGIFRDMIWYQHENQLKSHYVDEKDFLASCKPDERWRGGLPLKHRSSIFPDHLHRLAQLRADILVTHDAPECHRHGFAVLGDLARAMGVQALFHGHHHERIVYPEQYGGYRAFSVGLREIVDEYGSLVFVPAQEV